MTDDGVVEASKKEGFVSSMNPTLSSTDSVHRLSKLTEAQSRSVDTEHMQVQRECCLHAKVSEANFIGGVRG